MPKLPIGVIGLGHLGKYHAEKLAQIPEAHLVALCDINSQRLKETEKKLLEKYGLQPFCTQNFTELLPLVTAVVIATPTITHYDIAKRAIEEGKAVLVEKPLTHDFSKALELVELAERKGIYLQVGYVERYQRVVEELKKRVTNPLFIEAHRIGSFAERNLDIDVILDLMVHDLDLIFLFKKKEDLEFIHAIGAPVFTDKPDIVNARLIFKDGTTCNLTASRISLSKQRKFRVFAKGTYLRIDTIEKSLIQVFVDPQKKDYNVEKRIFQEDDPLFTELRVFVNSALGLCEKPFPARETLPSLEVAFRVKEEVEKNFQKLTTQYLCGS